MLCRWWLQSWLAGVPKVVAGGRDRQAGTLSNQQTHNMHPGDRGMLYLILHTQHNFCRMLHEVLTRRDIQCSMMLDRSNFSVCFTCSSGVDALTPFFAPV